MDNTIAETKKTVFNGTRDEVLQRTFTMTTDECLEVHYWSGADRIWLFNKLKYKFGEGRNYQTVFLPNKKLFIFRTL